MRVVFPIKLMTMNIQEVIVLRPKTNMIINERHFKIDSSLAPSGLVVRSVPSHIGNVGSVLYS